ncbi:MAG: DUF975 family protein [Clostridiales Family XIII bacterium]|nr:DUF975 family protein [Clostridiales Family XIII bacterium]
MRKIEDIKRDARRKFRRNFIICFLSSLIVVFLVNGVVSISETINEDEKVLKQIAKSAPDTPLQRFIDTVMKDVETAKKATSLGDDSHAGAIATVYIGTQKAGGVGNAIADMANKSILKGKISARITSYIGGLLSILFYIFVGGLIEIGNYRLYLETRLYPKTPLTRVFFVFRNKKIRHTAFIVFLKKLYLILWALTIVGFPIMYYSYYFVPLMQAENPGIPRRDIFRLAVRMMKGNKWRTFCFDLSFIGWGILALLSFGIVGALWYNPYRAASKAELYAELRAGAKARNIPGSGHLNDEILFDPAAAELRRDLSEDVAAKVACAAEQGIYPEELYHGRPEDVRHWLHVTAKDHYSFLNVTLMFFLFSFVGWVWECSVAVLEYGGFVNRGTLYGPWIPIYGVGGIVIILVLNRFNHKPMACFFSAMLLCGVIEYLGATILWEWHHIKYWDYSGYFLNIQGRVCLEGLLAFGTLGMVGLYVIAPATDTALNKIPAGTRKGICALLFAAFGTDLVYSQIHPHTGPGITEGLK